MEEGKSTSMKADTKLAVNKKPMKGKAVKDPNKPKRPASAYFVFMEDFRKQLNKDNPNNKAVSPVAKAARAKWKSMTYFEKYPYLSESDDREYDYKKAISAYHKRQAKEPAADEENKSISEAKEPAADEENKSISEAEEPAADEEGSDKSISEVNEEDDSDDDEHDEEYWLIFKKPTTSRD